MSPEQWQGTPTDARTDLWALGCILYELVAGQPAFPGDMQSIARAIVKGAPAPLDLATPHAEIAALTAIVNALLSKVPDERPDTCEVLIERLKNAFP